MEPEMEDKTLELMVSSVSSWHPGHTKVFSVAPLLWEAPGLDSTAGMS